MIIFLFLKYVALVTVSGIPLQKVPSSGPFDLVPLAPQARTARARHQKGGACNTGQPVACTQLHYLSRTKIRLETEYQSKGALKHKKQNKTKTKTKNEETNKTKIKKTNKETNLILEAESMKENLHMAHKEKRNKTNKQTNRKKEKKRRKKKSKQKPACS